MFTSGIADSWEGARSEDPGVGREAEQPDPTKLQTGGAAQGRLLG